VHDLHVWTLTSGTRAATAHLLLGAGVDSRAVLERAQAPLHDDIGIEHVTFQLEPHGFEHEPELV
jgi:cobalt-zinc-cadmium efflux system protein